MSATPPEYAYLPLDDTRKQIRLLVFEAGSQSNNEILVCQARYATLSKEESHREEDDFTYETISYCWGDSSIRGKIQIDSSVLDIPRSSELAIRCMLSSDEKRTLWIDAVCINQADTDERSQQVAIMTDIYRRGLRNLVYLGEPDEYTEAAIESIDLLMRTEIADAINHGRSLIDTLYQQHGANRIPVTSKTGLAVPVDQEALCAFYQRPWFSRLWVVQEIARSRESVVVCGRHEVNMIHALMSAKWLQYKFSYVDPTLRETVFPAARIFGFADETHSIFRSKDLNVNLLQVLDLARGLDYTEPLDVVYAVLGLVDWSTQTSSGLLPTRLRPDYDRPLHQLLTSAAHIIVFSQWSFQLFDDLAHRSQEDIHVDGLPSWVPRWHRRRDGTEDASALTLFFNASAGATWPSPEMESAIDTDLPGQLTVDGVQLDVIDHVHPTTRPWTWNNFYSDFIEPLQKAMFQIRDAQSCLPYILTAGAWFDGRPINKDQILVIQDICEKLAATLGSEAPQDLPPLTIADGPPQEVSDERTRLLLEGKHAILSACNKRAVCTTDRGLPSLVPDVTQSRDVLVVLFGGDTPFVLRPVGDGKYVLIGVCYLHDMMQGEAVEEYKVGREPGRTFMLV